MILVVGQVKVTHTKFAKVSRMKTIHVGAMVMQTTRHTTTTRMLTMLPHTTMTGGDVTALLAILLITSSLEEAIIHVR